jgi:hypothetical protein
VVALRTKCANPVAALEVHGSDTGKRYRIRHGRMMNIDELDSVGKRVCEWCFLPEGQLAAGDVMLAPRLRANKGHQPTGADMVTGHSCISARPS